MQTSQRARMTPVLCGLILMATSPAIGLTQYFVDGDAGSPAPDGLSWCTAFPTLQDALDVAFSGDVIFVANGLYTPDPTGLVDPRDASFELVDGVQIGGGFAGCGAAVPNERDPIRFETVLSGDLSGDDETGGTNTDNSYHVVKGRSLTGSTTLDGLTITGGNANGTSELRNRGGGLLLDDSDGSIRNCVIRANRAFWGAGIYNQDSSPFLLNTVITGNVSTGSGAGVYDVSVGSIDGSTLRNCLLYDNHSLGGSGGAIRSDEGATKLQNCTVVDNSAIAVGGGLYAFTATPNVRNSILWNNVDFHGTSQSSQLNAGAAIIDYTCMMGWDGTLGGTGNFGDDPQFTVGPLGCFYLSHLDGGESVTSPCVDASFDAAADLALDLVTTRSDAIGDTGAADLGFHYAITADVLRLGDFNRDEIVDLGDYGAWIDCMTGPISAELPACCRIADFDDDEDIDLFDVAEFWRSLKSP